MELSSIGKVFYWLTDKQQTALHAGAASEHTSALSSASSNDSNSTAAGATSLQVQQQQQSSSSHPPTTPSPVPANNAHAQHPLQHHFAAPSASVSASNASVTQTGSMPPAPTLHHGGASTTPSPAVVMPPTNSQQQLLNNAAASGNKLLNGPTSHLPGGVLPMKQNTAVSPLYHCFNNMFTDFYTSCRCGCRKMSITFVFIFQSLSSQFCGVTSSFRSYCLVAMTSSRRGVVL